MTTVTPRTVKTIAREISARKLKAELRGML